MSRWSSGQAADAVHVRTPNIYSGEKGSDSLSDASNTTRPHSVRSLVQQGVLAPFHRSSSVSVASADSMTCCRLTNQASWMSCWGELTECLNGRVGNDSFNGWDGDMVRGAQGHDRTIRSPWTAMRRLRSA